MELICVVCLKKASVLYKGNSLCQEHYCELEESGRGGSNLDRIVKQYTKRLKAEFKQ